MKKTKMPLWSVILFFCFLAFGQGVATTMLLLSLEELTAKADVIVQCKVDSIRSEWNNDRTMIYTFVDLRPLQFMKNQVNISGTIITLKLMGGAVGEIETVLVGSPKFQKEEEAILFIRQGHGRHFEGYMEIVGLAQGKFDVIQNTVISKKIVSRNLNRIHLLKNSRTEALKLPMQYEVFLERIKKAIKTQ